MIIFIALIISFFANFWIWRFLSQKQYPEFLIVLLISLFLIFFRGWQSKIKYLICLLPLFFILARPLPKTIFNLEGLDIYILNERRAYYSKPIWGKIFENKLTKYFYNYEKNFFEALDLNYYFFGTHPRERVGIKEFEKFSVLLTPFGFLGLCLSLKRRNFLGIFYFSLTLLFISFFKSIDTFSYLLFPFFAFNFYLGIEEAGKRLLGKNL